MSRENEKQRRDYTISHYEQEENQKNGYYRSPLGYDPKIRTKRQDAMPEQTSSDNIDSRG